MRYGGKEEKMIYDNDRSFNQLSLSEEKNILLLKEFIIRKYCAEKAKSELILKRQIKAKQVWDSKIPNTPSLKYPTKLQVWDSEIMNIRQLNYPTTMK